MSKTFPINSPDFNPFGELIGLIFSESQKGTSRCTLKLTTKLLNPFKVVHGGVLYTMCDTGMGAALFSEMQNHETCSTIEIKIIYFKSVVSGILICDTKIINRGKNIVTLESVIMNNANLAAKAIGTFYVRKSKK